MPGTPTPPEPVLASWRVSDVLARYPDLLEVLARQSPHFSRLRNPVLRRVQSRLVTVGQAARIAGLEPTVLVQALNAALGLATPAPGAAEASVREDAAPFEEVPVAEEVDARPLLARGEEPFGAIVAAARRVPAGLALRLRAPFEPLPLYDVLGRQGFRHRSRQLGPDDWEVLFARVDPQPDEPLPTEPPGHAPVRSGAPDAVVRIDVGDLVPPEPMVRILEAAARLQPGQTLLVEHVRRPVFLYPQLDAQGFAHETRELGPGRIEILIRRAGAAERA